MEKKAETSRNGWARLTEDKTKNANIQVDWNRYKDSDDEGDEIEDPFMDLSMMQATGLMGDGMPEMSGMSGGVGMPGMSGHDGIPSGMKMSSTELD